MTDPQRDEFEDMLRVLTLERSQIKAAMGFALDNADAAGEVFFINYIATFNFTDDHVLHRYLSEASHKYLKNITCYWIRISSFSSKLKIFF